MKKLTKLNVFSYGLGDASYQAFSIIQSMFLLYFIVNYSGISAAVVGIIMMVARIWDAINDPIMGVIVDRTNHKYGKARPYMLWFAIPTALCFAAIFNIPVSFPMWAKITWLTVFYLGFTTCITAVTIPHNTLMVRMTDDSSERMSLSRSRSLLGTVGLVGGAGAMMILASGKTNEGEMMSIIALAIAIVSALLYFGVFFGTKEYSTKNDTQRNFFKGLKSVITNKYWLMLLVGFVTYGIMYAISNGVLLFYLTSRYQAADMQVMMMAIMTVGMVIMSILSKPLADKIGKKNLVLLGLGIAIFACLMRLILQDSNVWIFLSFFALTQVGLQLYHVSTKPITGDIIDYSEYKTGQRNESLTFSALTLGNKMGVGFATAAVGFMLDAAGYVPNQVEQTDKVINTMYTASNTIPLIALTIIFVIYSMYNLEKRMPEIKKALVERRGE